MRHCRSITFIMIYSLLLVWGCTPNKNQSELKKDSTETISEDMQMETSCTIEVCEENEDNISACSISTCNPQNGRCEIVAAEDGTSCDTGGVCTENDRCMNGICTAGSVLNCDDGNACNGIEVCDDSQGCIAGSVLNCDDGNACNGIEVCDDSQGCIAGSVLNCDDGNACNGIEVCDDSQGCIAGSVLNCDDGNACNGIEVCDNSQGCLAGHNTPCENGGICNEDSTGVWCECQDEFAGDYCQEVQVCGDGIRSNIEECDDANTNLDDGCSDQCQVEWGYYCSEEQRRSQCTALCGDGIKARIEGCDDGNVIDEDGCSAACLVETPVTFTCAIANHEGQIAIAPEYWYAEAHGGVADTEIRQPIRKTWEPILEEVPGCNGLPWQAQNIDKSLKVFSFLVVLDASWVTYYNANQVHFSTQGYPTLESSPGILIDRASYLYEAQFGVRIQAYQVVAFPNLLEKCSENNLYTENEIQDATNTRFALQNAGIELAAGSAGIMRLGVGANDSYCHSYAPFSGICTNALFVNQRKPFADNSGRLKHESARVLAHELGHFFGVCRAEEHPHCLNGHLTNEIPDIMVWDGRPAVNVRDFGMFYKFMTSCTPVYDELLCETVRDLDLTCAVPFTCENGGLDCETEYWSAKGSLTDSEDPIQPDVRPRDTLLHVRCCSVDESNVCVTEGLGGLNSTAECSGLMNWPQADLFCRQAGMRLCSLDEISILNLCEGTGCDYDRQRIWTGTSADFNSEN